MDTVRRIFHQKPLILVGIPFVYLVAVAGIKWGMTPPIHALWFMGGGICGVYFLDAAEEFFHLTPSPFRSIVFAAGFALVSLFVVTSSGSFMTGGLVLSLYLTLILWQLGEWHTNGTLVNWYQILATPVQQSTQRGILVGFIVLFIVETMLFIR